MNKALELFKQKNTCTQSVYKAFNPDTSEEKMLELKALSGGRAPDNTCGALYAGKLILSDEKYEELKTLFIEKNGSHKCKELKMVHKTACDTCVKTAYELIEKIK